MIFYLECQRGYSRTCCGSSKRSPEVCAGLGEGTIRRRYGHKWKGEKPREERKRREEKEKREGRTGRKGTRFHTATFFPLPASKYCNILIPAFCILQLYQSNPWVQFLRPNPTHQMTDPTQPKPYHNENLDAGPTQPTTQPNP